jgi:hypothetical protein
MKLYQEFATTLQAYRNCVASGNTEWQGKHLDKLERLSEELPSGSGIDSGTKFDIDASTPNKLVFTLGYHHMNDTGYYDGWTEHRLIVTPDLASGYNLKITGRDRNQIKDYLYDVYGVAMSAELASV